MKSLATRVITTDQRSLWTCLSIKSQFQTRLANISKYAMYSTLKQSDNQSSAHWTTINDNLQACQLSRFSHKLPDFQAYVTIVRFCQKTPDFRRKLGPKVFCRFPIRSLCVSCS